MNKEIQCALVAKLLNASSRLIYKGEEYLSPGIICIPSIQVESHSIIMNVKDWLEKKDKKNTKTIFISPGVYTTRESD